MTAYEFFWDDYKGEPHFLGILPERRKKIERITKESILNWGRMIIGDNGEVDDIYYIPVEV